MGFWKKLGKGLATGGALVATGIVVNEAIKEGSRLPPVVIRRYKVTIRVPEKMTADDLEDLARIMRGAQDHFGDNSRISFPHETRMFGPVRVVDVEREDSFDDEYVRSFRRRVL